MEVDELLEGTDVSLIGMGAIFDLDREGADGSSDDEVDFAT